MHSRGEALLSQNALLDIILEESGEVFFVVYKESEYLFLSFFQCYLLVFFKLLLLLMVLVLAIL